MMLVASHFFYVHRVSEKDTTVGGHVCVGINGQKELISLNKDYTVLEAFCFEGIFKNLNKRNFTCWQIFSARILEYSKIEKESFVNYESFVKNVKYRCYNDMEKDPVLKKALLRYYESNKNNIGFVIK